MLQILAYLVKTKSRALQLEIFHFNFTHLGSILDELRDQERHLSKSSQTLF